MVSTGREWFRSTTCGRCSSPSASPRISFGMVAEKSRFCRFCRQRGEDAADVRQESHVEHVIRLVQHEGLDAVQPQHALLLQVEHAAGTADDDLRSLAQRADLLAGRDAAEDRHGLDVRESGQGADLLVDLARQLASRRHDQHPRSRSAPGQQPLEHGQRECGGLAGSRLGQAQDVAALEGGGNGFLLDRAWFDESGRGDAALDFLAQGEVGEPGWSLVVWVSDI